MRERKSWSVPYMWIELWTRWFPFPLPPPSLVQRGSWDLADPQAGRSMVRSYTQHWHRGSDVNTHTEEGKSASYKWQQSSHNRWHSAGVLTACVIYMHIYLVETVYLSAWCSHGTSATVIRLMSSFLIPRLDPFIVTEICPILGPYRGVIWSESMGKKKFRTDKL